VVNIIGTHTVLTLEKRIVTEIKHLRVGVALFKIFSVGITLKRLKTLWIYLHSIYNKL